MCNFITIGVFLHCARGTFIAMVQITVYTGAIMVLFLFVIMLLGAERLEGAQTCLTRRGKDHCRSFGCGACVSIGYLIIREAVSYRYGIAASG